MRKLLALRIVAALAAALLLYAAFGFLLAPRILESRLKAFCEERLGEPLALERLRVNPFTFSAEASGVRLGKGETPLVLARRLSLDFGPLASGFGRGWVLDELQVDALQAEIDLLPDGRLNVAPLASRWRQTAGAAQPDEPPPRITIRHLLLTEGALTFRDFQSALKPESQALPVRVELSNVTTIPDREGRYSLHAQFVGGGSVSWQGNVALVPLRSEGELALRGLPLATLWKFASERLGIARPAGTMDFSAHYRFSYGEGKPGLALERVQLAADSVAIARTGERSPWLRAKRLEAKDGRFDLARRIVTLPSVLLTALHFEDRSRAKPLAVDLGSLAASASLQLEGAVRAQEVNVHAQKISLTPADGGGRALDVAALDIERAHVDAGKRAAGAGLVSVRGGALSVTREPDGTIAELQMFQPAQSSAPWHFDLGELRVEDLSVPFSDASFAQPIAYELGGLSGRLTNLGNGKPAAFEASAQLGGGTLKASGTAASGLDTAQARVQMSGVDLVPLQPLVGKYTDVKLAARASADARVDYRSSGKPALRAIGSVALDGLALTEPGRGPVLASRRVSAGDVRLSFSPHRLAIREIVLQSPQARIAISQQHELNLAQLVKKQPERKPQQARSGSGSQPFPVSIGSLRVRDGTVDYSDLSLVLPFSARVTAFQGSAAGLSSDPGRRAELEFRGEVGESGSVRVKGSIDAAAPTQFTDIGVAFENVQMPPLSPYSATFLGRKISSGDVWLDLDYKITDGRLTGQNKITARNLTLGEHVNAPNALDVPLDLVVALLTDAQGKIAADVPVSGDLGNPDFQIGPALRSAFAGLVRRIVSAPFRALAGLLGSKGEELESVAFDPGSAALLPPERDKLREVAKALKDRPQLRLVVHPAYDPGRDGRALREEEARRELDKALGRKLQPGEAAGPVAFDSPPVQRALERLLAQHDPQAADQVAADFTRRNGREPQRTSLLGALFGAKGDPQFYRAVFERLVQSEPLSEEAGRELAQKREEAIRQYVESAGIEASRIEVGSPAPRAEASDRVSARLSLQA